MNTDPIKLSHIRDNIRLSKHRLSGLIKCIEYVSMLSMNPEDKQMITNQIAELRNEAMENYKNAILEEDSYVKTERVFLENKFPFIN